jgi:hypothetical protein
VIRQGRAVLSNANKVHPPKNALTRGALFSELNLTLAVGAASKHTLMDVDIRHFSIGEEYVFWRYELEETPPSRKASVRRARKWIVTPQYWNVTTPPIMSLENTQITEGKNRIPVLGVAVVAIRGILYEPYSPIRLSPLRSPSWQPDSPPFSRDQSHQLSPSAQDLGLSPMRFPAAHPSSPSTPPSTANSYHNSLNTPHFLSPLFCFCLLFFSPDCPSPSGKLLLCGT